MSVPLKNNFLPFLTGQGIDWMVERVFRPHFYPAERRAAWAAASLATGTRYGEQLT